MYPGCLSTVSSVPQIFPGATKSFHGGAKFFDRGIPYQKGTNIPSNLNKIIFCATLINKVH